MVLMFNVISDFILTFILKQKTIGSVIVSMIGRLACHGTCHSKGSNKITSIPFPGY